MTALKLLFLWAGLTLCGLALLVLVGLGIVAFVLWVSGDEDEDYALFHGDHRETGGQS